MEENMTAIETFAHARADLVDREITASVELAAAPERVFRALSSREVTDWWVRAGVFDTREWSGDVRVGGRWNASGIGRGNPYRLEGEFLEVDAPRSLVHTWHPADAPGTPSVVSYRLEPTATGTRVTLRHTGIAAPEVAEGTCVGWRTSFERLAEILGPAR
jgi:uncharacterized protein YndB with AHSA1/START domain